MSDLKRLIYKAQCIGNVEPIEYMVPYPNLRALIEGQNIKYGKKMVYADYGLSSDKIYRMAQQAANFFTSLFFMSAAAFAVSGVVGACSPFCMARTIPKNFCCFLDSAGITFYSNS